MRNEASIEISVAARSATGSCRDTNEDAAHVLDLAEDRGYVPPVKLARCVGSVFVVGVYDGCGHGELGTPSGLVAAEVEASMRSAPVLPAREALALRLREAVERGNVVLFARGRTRPNGMGTTATVAGICEGAVVVSHIGDSRAYLARDGKLTQLTRDHTLIEEARAARALSGDALNDLSPEKRWLREAGTDLPANVLLRAIGVTDVIEVDVSSTDARPGDRLLLCTDGLTGMVDDHRIGAILAAHEEPADACDALVAAAEKAGGHDNVSVVVVAYFGP